MEISSLLTSWPRKIAYNLGLCFQTNIQTGMPVPLLERDLLPTPEVRTACPEVRTVTPFRVSGRGKRGAVLPSPLAEELSPLLTSSTDGSLFVSWLSLHKLNKDILFGTCAVVENMWNIAVLFWTKSTLPKVQVSIPILNTIKSYLYERLKAFVMGLIAC